MGLTLDEPKNNEVTFLVNGIDVLMDDNIKAFAEGNTVDYVESTYGGNFTIVSPGGHAC